METGVTYFLLLVLLQLVSGDTYDGFQPRYYNRGERRLGKVVLYRTTGSTRYPTPEASLLRDTHTSRRYPHDSRNAIRYFQARSDHGPRYSTNRKRFGTDAEPERKYFERRTGKGHPENYKTDSSIQRYRYRQERTPNGIDDYLDRFNYDYFNSNDVFHVPLNNFYNQALGLQFRPDLRNNFETFVATGPGSHRHVIRVPPLTDQDTQLQEHKYMTRAQFTRDREPLVTFNGEHRFSKGNRAPTNQEHHQHFYKGIPVFEQNNLGGKEYDPRFLAIYKSIIEAYKQQIQDPPQREENFLQKSHNYQPNKNIPDNKDNIFQNFIEKYKNLNAVISTQPEQQLPHNGLILGHVKEPSYRSPPFGDKTERFRPSPPFYRYSEPDPLYHPNHSPLQTHNPALLGTTEITKPTAPSRLMTTTAPPSTEKVVKFPDSINAQLPPPGDDEDTRIPYVAATVVTPQTAANDQTTPMDMVTDMHRNVHSVPTTIQPVLSTTSNKITHKENSSLIFQKYSDAISQLIIPKITVSHEVPLLNASVIFITVEEVTTTKPLTPSSPEKNIPNEIPVENTASTSTSGYTTPGSEKIASLMQDSSHFQPTIFTEETPHLRHSITVPNVMHETSIPLENLSATEDTSNIDNNITHSSTYEVSTVINDTFETTTAIMTQSQDEVTISSQGDSDDKLIMAFQEKEIEVNTNQETTTISGIQSKPNNNQEVSFSQEQNTNSFTKFEIGKSIPPAMSDMNFFTEQESSVTSSDTATGHENNSTTISGGNNMLQFKKHISTPPEVLTGRQDEKSSEEDVGSNEQSSYSSTQETEDISKKTK